MPKDYLTKKIIKNKKIITMLVQEMCDKHRSRSDQQISHNIRTLQEETNRLKRARSFNNMSRNK